MAAAHLDCNRREERLEDGNKMSSAFASQNAAKSTFIFSRRFSVRLTYATIRRCPVSRLASAARLQRRRTKEAQKLRATSRACRRIKWKRFARMAPQTPPVCARRRAFSPQATTLGSSLVAATSRSQLSHVAAARVYFRSQQLAIADPLKMFARRRVSKTSA